jgi:uncharacterized protein (TIGR02145 family)
MENNQLLKWSQKSTSTVVVFNQILSCFLYIIAITTILSCASENNTEKSAPQLTTTTISNISLNSAESGGNVTSDGGDVVTTRGIVWNTVTSPTTSLTTKTINGTGTGSFSSSITNLIPSNIYFVRAYATNSIGTGYGNELSFTTGAIVLPTLTTTAITTITTNSGVSGGNITVDGGGIITARGIVWSTSQNPTIALTTKTTDGTGLGSFVSNMTTLVQNTTYYVKAYATNSTGTAYGNQVEFKTNASPITGTVTDADGNVYKTIQFGTQLWMAENLKTTKYCNGDIIPNVTNANQWNNLTSGAYVFPDNNSSLNNAYGKLYNGYVASDPRNACPCGWRVPSADDWIVLGEYIGGSWIWNGGIKYYGYAADIGGKMKSSGNIEDGTGLWIKSNYPGNNLSGFNGLPVGYSRSDDSIVFNFMSRGEEGYWWCSTFETRYNNIQYVEVNNFSQDLYLSYTPISNNSASSIRCIKNQ